MRGERDREMRFPMAGLEFFRGFGWAFGRLGLLDLADQGFFLMFFINLFLLHEENKGGFPKKR
jgi:hypothetical protein